MTLGELRKQLDEFKGFDQNIKIYIYSDGDLGWGDIHGIRYDWDHSIDEGVLVLNGDEEKLSNYILTRMHRNV